MMAVEKANTELTSHNLFNIQKKFIDVFIMLLNNFNYYLIGTANFNEEDRIPWF